MVLDKVTKVKAMWMDAAKVVISSLQLLVLVLLCLSVTTPAQPSSGRPVPHDYSRRFAQVTRQCQSLLSSATELSVDTYRADGHFSQLSFKDGDWNQEAGDAPLFPFHELPEAAEPLASFRLTKVEVHQRRRAFNASGFLSFTLPCNGGCRPKKTDNELWHGVAKFHIHFEGLYIETPPLSGSGGDSDGERVLCMVGNSALPMRWRSSNGTSSWDRVKEQGGETDIIETSTETGGNGNILLVLRYPKAHTLTTRAVRGEMTSLGSKSDGAYFDTVRLVSRLGPYSCYTLRREDEEPDAAGCSDNHASFRDGDVAAGHVYRGASFCEILGQFTSHKYGHGLLSVVPNWNCSSTDELFCSRPGPFESRGGGDRVRSMAFARSAVAVQDLQCAPAPGGGRDGTPTPAAKVAAVFRFVAPWEDQPTAAERTGLSGATLSAEGTWSAATGRLCMVACLGPGKGACHYRVTLYVPTAFSITRRSIVVGQITATNGSHYPLSFQQGLGHSQEWHRFGRSGQSVPMAYHYTKITQAREMKLIQGRGASVFRDNFIARSLLSYPKIAGTADDLVSLSYLAGDLTLDFQPTSKTPPPFVPEWIEDPFLEFRILSIDSLVGRYSPASEDGGGSSMPVEVEKIDSGHGHGVQKQQMLNVSGVFMASRNDEAGRQIPVMSLEGVYNPEDGRMFLIGCRNVDAPWRVLTTIRDLEDGMDCSIQVRVEYPPTKNRWMASRAAKVSVTSTRDDSDPLHFSRTELRTLPSYDHYLGMLPESTQGLLCIAMLSAIVAATISQLRYVNSHGEVTPYVSLAMLGVQALGYSATLVTGARMVPAWPVYMYTYRMYGDHMDSSVKALTLAALLLTVWLAQKVCLSRAAARARSPLEPGRVPRDGAVLLCSFAVHSCCLLFVLAVHWLLSTCGMSSATPPPPAGETYADGQITPTNLLCTWGHVVGRYVGVAKEWFLLPQVIANAAWHVNCKPLAGRYYAGVTMAWLLPHAYGFLWPPYVNVYTEANYDIMRYIYSKSTAVMVPVIGVTLALLVYVQQRWNYKTVGWTHRNKLPQHDY